MATRIDLNAVPSAMEACAATWKGKGCPPPPMKPKVKPKGHQTYPKADFVASPAPRPSQPRIDHEPLPGQNQMARKGKWTFKYGGGEVDFPTKAAMDAYIADLRSRMAPPDPDPEQYVLTLPFHVCQALEQAFRCREAEFAGHWEVPRGDHEREMFALGITAKIGKKHRIVSHFGMKLRRVLMRDAG